MQEPLLQGWFGRTADPTSFRLFPETPAQPSAAARGVWATRPGPIYLFKSEEAGIYTMENKTGKNWCSHQCWLCSQREKLMVELWRSLSARAGQEPRRKGPEDTAVGTQSVISVWFQTALALGIPAEGLSLTFAEGSLPLLCCAQPRLGDPKPLLEQPSMPRVISPLFLTKNPAHVSNWISEKCKVLLQCLPSSYGAGGVLPFLSCWNRYIP